MYLPALLATSCLAESESDLPSALQQGQSLLESRLIGQRAQSLLDSCKRAYACDDFDAAVDFAKEATELEPEASVCQLWLGIAYSEKTESGFFVNRLLNARKCKGAFERAVELAPNSLDAREGLIEYHVRAPGVAGGSAETAWEHVEFIMQHDSVRGYLAAAYIHERKEQDATAAEQALLDAVAAETANIASRLRLAGFYARHESFNKAESVLVAAAASGDRQALLNLAWFHINQNHNVEALAVLSGILAGNPSDLDALLYAAEAQICQPDHGLGDSLDAVFRSIADGCTEIKYLSGVRGLYSDATLSEEVDQLMLYLESKPCLTYRPCWSYPHLLSGIDSYRPGRSRANFRLAYCYERLSGKGKDSRKALERALELDPTFWPASQELKSPETD